MPLAPQLLELPVRTAARLVCLRLLADAEVAAERVRERRDGEALHDFRVALRRLRVAIRAFRPALDDTVRRRDRARLRELLRDTAWSRDAEAQIAWIDRLLADDPGTRAGCQLLVDRLAAGRSGAARRVGRIVERRFPTVARGLGKRLSRYRVTVDPAAPEGPGSTAAALGAAVARGAAELRGRVAALDPSARGEAATRARVAAKRLRYLIEPFEPELEEGSELVRSLRELQTLLGDLEQLEALALSLASWTDGDEGPEALDRLARRLRMRREESARALSDHWLAAALPALLSRVDELATRLGGPGEDVEIERKFLLRGFPDLPGGSEPLEVEQGWFGTRIPERVRRVRSREGERCYRAIKHGMGVKRLELEELIPPGLFATLWPLTEGRRVRKRRYRVREGELVWEIDRFTDRDLVLAEVELPTPDHPVVLPAWLEPHLVREVTGEAAYVNLNLAW